MKWIDVTLPMSEALPVWPGDPPYLREITGRIAPDGSGHNISRLHVGAHFGTHVDAPFHFIDGGRTVDELPVDLFVGPCVVIRVPDEADLVEPQHLSGVVPMGTERLLVRTRNSEYLSTDMSFHTDYVAFSEDCVRYALELGVKLIGIDYYSIGPFPYPGRVHKAFLRSNDTAAVEGLDLSRVDPGPYQLICLPLRITGGDGSPARVLLGR